MHRTAIGRLAVAIALALAIAALPSAAFATGLPKLLWNTRCAHPCRRLIGEYAVRPHTVVLVEAYGGNLTLHWSSWTAQSASGSGTSVVSGMGQTTRTPVQVEASEPVDGRFTLLTLKSTEQGRSFHETLVLRGVGSDPAFQPLTQ